MHCITCQYDLTNLAERRCPECGRAFEPSNPESYFDPVKLRALCVSHLKRAVLCASIPPAFFVLITIIWLVTSAISDDWTANELVFAGFAILWLVIPGSILITFLFFIGAMIGGIPIWRRLIIPLLTTLLAILLLWSAAILLFIWKPVSILDWAVD